MNICMMYRLCSEMRLAPWALGKGLRTHLVPQWSLLWLGKQTRIHTSRITLKRTMMSRGSAASQGPDGKAAFTCSRKQAEVSSVWWCRHRQQSHEENVRGVTHSKGPALPPACPSVPASTSPMPPDMGPRGRTCHRWETSTPLSPGPVSV